MAEYNAEAVRVHLDPCTCYGRFHPGEMCPTHQAIAAALTAAYAAGVAAERARLVPVILHAAAYLEEVGDLCDCQGPGEHDARCHAVLLRVLRDGPRGG